MSHPINDLIRERAREASDIATNSMLGAQLDEAIKRDDLDEMRELTLAIERHLDYLDTLKEDTH